MGSSRLMTNHPNRNWKRRWAENPAAYLREWRELHGFTHSALAAALPCSVRAIEDWEAGRRTPPDYLPRALRDIAK